MRKQAGNVLLWIVLGVVAVGLGAVIVWRYFAATDSLDNSQQAEQTSNVTTANAVTVEKAQLPENWSIYSSDKDSAMVNTADHKTGYESGVGYGCYAQVVRVKDADATASDADAYAAKLYNDLGANVSGNKGYAKSALGVVNLSLQEGQKTITIAVHADKLVSPDGSQITYQRNGYIVRDGYYYSVTQSCDENNFADSDKALEAFTIRP